MQNKAEVEAVKKEMVEVIAKHTLDRKFRMKQLQDQLEGLWLNLAETTEHNRDDKLKARRDKTRTEAALPAKIRQLDRAMESKTAELEKNLKQETHIIEYMLKEYFDKVDVHRAPTEHGGHIPVRALSRAHPVDHAQPQS